MHFKDKSELDSLLSIDTGERVLVNQDEFLFENCVEFIVDVTATSLLG